MFNIDIQTMSKIFEIITKDFAGRIGHLKTKHGVVETPAFLPVINPRNQIIPPKEMNKFGIEMIITNSYIIYSDNQLREKIRSCGIHTYLEYDKPIMTDSGSYQLSVYGSIDVNNNDIIKFQNEIGSDVCVPLDIPTSPDTPFELSLKDLNITNKRIKEGESIYNVENYDSIYACPIQGSTHLTLREKSSQFCSNINCGIYPIGAVVPLMEAYRYEDLVNIIVASKKNLNPTFPVHLFGAGHPSMLSLAVLLGCDLFDSAAYALYAKDGRYITPEGTYKIENLKYFPCSCPICSSYTPKELKKDNDFIKLLSEHNLYSISTEIKVIKQAICEGSLFELVERRCHSHPKLIDALKSVGDYKYWIEPLDPSSKSTFMSFGYFSSERPEIIKYSKRANRFNFQEVTNALISSYHGIYDENYDQLFKFKPPFGSYPVDLEETYPFNFESPKIPSYKEFKIGILNTIEMIKHYNNIDFSFLVDEYMMMYDEKLINTLGQYCHLIYKM